MKAKYYAQMQISAYHNLLIKSHKQIGINQFNTDF